MGTKGTLVAALARVSEAEVLERITRGEYATTVARELGVNASSLTRHFKDDPRWREALEDGAAARLENAELDLRSAQAPIDVMRGTAVWKAVSWRAEKEHPDRWGGKPQVQVNVGMAMDSALGESAATLMAKIRRNEAGHQMIDVPVPEPLRENGEPV